MPKHKNEFEDDAAEPVEAPEVLLYLELLVPANVTVPGIGSIRSDGQAFDTAGQEIVGDAFVLGPVSPEVAAEFVRAANWRIKQMIKE